MTETSAYLEAIAQAEKYKRRADLYKAAIKHQKSLRNLWRKRIKALEIQRDQWHQSYISICDVCERQAASHEHDREMFTKREEQHRLALERMRVGGRIVYIDDEGNSHQVCDPATCSSKTIAEPCSRMVDGVCVLSGRVQG